MSRIFNKELNIATEADCTARWSCGKPGQYFRCGFCGYKFKVGDGWRGVYTNSTPNASGNPLVCAECNKDDKSLIKEWQDMHEIAKTKFWWFCNYE